MNHGEQDTECSDQDMLHDMLVNTTTRANSYINAIANRSSSRNERCSHVVEWNDADYGIEQSNTARTLKSGNIPVAPTKKRWTQHGAPRQSWMQQQVKLNDNNKEVSVKDAYNSIVSQADWSSGSSGKILRR
jgi:hypothetical protein